MVDLGLLMVGAGIAVGLTGLGAGWAERDVGAAAVGAITEDVGLFGKAMVLMVLPGAGGIAPALFSLTSTYICLFHLSSRFRVFFVFFLGPPGIRARKSPRSPEGPRGPGCGFRRVRLSPGLTSGDQARNALQSELLVVDQRGIDERSGVREAVERLGELYHW